MFDATTIGVKGLSCLKTDIVFASLGVQQTNPLSTLERAASYAGPIAGFQPLPFIMTENARSTSLTLSTPAQEPSCSIRM